MFENKSAIIVQLERELALVKQSASHQGAAQFIDGYRTALGLLDAEDPLKAEEERLRELGITYWSTGQALAARRKRIEAALEKKLEDAEFDRKVKESLERQKVKHD